MAQPFLKARLQRRARRQGRSKRCLRSCNAVRDESTPTKPLGQPPAGALRAWAEDELFELRGEVVRTATFEP